MYKELGLSEADGVLAAYNAVCELVEDTERLQAACAAKEAELAELRGQTAELFGARLEAEGIGEEAVTAAKAMWQRDPQSVAVATLGSDFAEAANPYGCNQYGHEWRSKHGDNWGGTAKEVDDKGEMPTRKEIREFDNLSPRETKEKLKPFDDAVKKTIRAYTAAKKKYAAAYTLVHGRDKSIQVTEQEREELKKAEAALKTAQEEANEALRKRRRAYRANLKSGGAWSDEDIEQYLKSWPEKVRAAKEDERDLCDEELYTSDFYEELESSRTLEELLEEEDIVNAANPYGCNQYGHEWKGKHGEGWKPSGRGGEQKEKKDASTEKTVEEEAFDLDADMKKFFAADSDSRRAMHRKWMDEYKDARDRISDLAKNKNIDEETRNKEIEKWKVVANKNSKRIIKLTEIAKERERQRINNGSNNSKDAEKITKNFDSQIESVKRLYPEL